MCTFQKWQQLCDLIKECTFQKWQQLCDLIYSLSSTSDNSEPASLPSKGNSSVDLNQHFPKVSGLNRLDMFFLSCSLILACSLFSSWYVHIYSFESYCEFKWDGWFLFLFIDFYVHKSISKANCAWCCLSLMLDQKTEHCWVLVVFHVYTQAVPYHETASAMLTVLDKQSKKLFKGRGEVCNNLHQFSVN